MLSNLPSRRLASIRPIINRAFLSTRATTPSPPSTPTSTHPSTSEPSPGPVEKISKTSELEQTPPNTEEKALRLRRLAALEAQQAASLRAAIGERDGGGSAGIEYEDGLPVAMKRGVRENMFRLI